MLLMGIKEYAESRSISEKLVRKLMLAGQIPFGKSGKKYMLVPEVVDDRVRAIFSAETEKAEPKIERAAPKLAKGEFHAALKALVTT